MIVHSATVDRANQNSPEDESAFAAILEVLDERLGVDFTRYRLATVRRRVLNRMISARAHTFAEYLSLLRSDAAEAQHLLSRVTIKVSRFYRNKVTFDALRERVIPELANARADSPLRILSAGCGMGEESYSLAMLLEEAGIPGTIDAMDIDPQALALAALGRYDVAVLDEVPLELRQRYLEPTGKGFTVCEALRRRIVFTRRDVIAMSAESMLGGEYDLVCCRNVLIYFERESQERTLLALCRSIRAGGYLCLGEAEWPMATVAADLQPLPHKTRIFRVSRDRRHS